MSTMIVEFTTSFLVGHATLRSSPFTSPRYSLGPMRSRLGAADGGRGFPPSDAGDLGLSVPCFAIMRLVCRFIDTAAPSSTWGHSPAVKSSFTAGQEGLEPPTAGFGDRCSTN